MLSGQYYFRQVIYVPFTAASSLQELGTSESAGYLYEAVTVYGNIAFDGNGNWSITAGQVLDCTIPWSAYYEQCQGYVGSQVYTATGTYSIAASGYGVLSSPYVTGDFVYGLVSANGVFIGSSTENSFGYNDMLVMAPLASPAPTASSFTGTWACAGLDLSSGSPMYALNFSFTLNQDGNGNLNASALTGYEGVTTTPVPPGASLSGLKYTFSNGAAVAAFPNNGNLIVGSKYFYFSKDGDFLFGGSPANAATPFDLIVGVKTTANPTLSGLYYQAGFDEYEGQLDSYFGALNVIKGPAPQAFLGHQRVNYWASSDVYDYTFDDTLSLSGNSYTGPYAKYVVGAGGAEIITAGIGPSLGISVALQQPAIAPSGTVFIDPTRVQNSASNAPFTASIVPGELLTMYGQNLADSTQVVQGGQTFPTTLNNVQVNIGGYPAPIYYVSQGQLSAIVPYEVTPGSIVNIQVTNDMGSSNVVTAYVGATAPGVFTQNEEGTGYGDIVHLGIGNSAAAAYSLVSDANPAAQGETLSIYLTGLGAVSPSITDGGLGPSTTAAMTTNTIMVEFTGNCATTQDVCAATNDFAGLAPGFAGLYQLNFTMPATGLTAGANYLDIAGPDSYMSYQLIPVTTTAAAVATADAQSATGTPPPKFRRKHPATPALRRKSAANPGPKVDR